MRNPTAAPMACFDDKKKLGLGAKNYTLGAYFGDNLVFSFTSYLCTDLRIPKERSTFTTPPVDDLRNAT
ncbi:hypothetical protein HUJ04_007028 [Dendroctonus ponderosae]|nr:hypothetical protein HUJ04_007028 [Dendroctonus ponderosae]